ncbi:MAG: DNA-formamidopyrimidine glycosylase family protein [Dehalococcoidia bacterium]
MPEAPDLEVIKEFLAPRIVGCTVTAAVERKPLVLRNMTGEPFEADLPGRKITSVERRSKLLLIGLGRGRLLIISPMLTGGLRHCQPSTRMDASTCLAFDLSDGCQLRYFDQKRMGQVYLLPPGRSDEIVRLEHQGPDVLSEPLGLDEFTAALKPFRGEIKGILTRGVLVSGIGNAYADEVLFHARLFPFKKRTALSADDVRRLHEAVYSVPAEAVKTLRERMGADIHRKVRGFLKVHGKGGGPCPVCSSKITAITANQRLTNYCRQCQPGSLFRR